MSSSSSTRGGESSKGDEHTQFSVSMAAVHVVEQDIEEEVEGQSGRGDANVFDIEGVSKSQSEGGIKQASVEVSSLESFDVAANPVTRIASEYTESMVESIAVNDEFITYGLKQGHVRVLHRYSEARALLKGHTGPVSHMCFVSASIVAAGGMDGRVFVWKVQATDDENALQVDCLMSLVFSPGCEECEVLVCPFDENRMVVGVGNAVMVIDIVEKGSSVCDVDPLDPAPYGTRIGEFPLQDVATSISVSNEGVLAIGSRRGRVYVVRNVGTGEQCCQNVIVGEHVDRVDWVDRRGLMVSLKEGSKKMMFVLEADGTLVPRREMELSADPQPFVHTSYVAEKRVAVLADCRNKSLYVLTFGEDGTFDVLVKLTVGKPVLSVCAFWNQQSVEAGKGGLEVNCVQTDAVQQYYIDVDRYLSKDVVVPVEEGLEEAEQVQQEDGAAEDEEGEEDRVEEKEKEKEEEQQQEEEEQEEEEDMTQSKLLTPSDIISSQSEQAAPIKILKRGEKIPTAKPPVKKTTAVEIRKEQQAEAQDQKEESDEEEETSYEVQKSTHETTNGGVRSVPLELTGADASLGTLFNLISREIEKNASKERKHIEKSLKDHRKHVDDQIQKLTKSLDKKITSQIKSEIKGMQGSLASSVQVATKESIRTILPKEAMGAIKTSLDKTLSTAVQQGLSKPIQDSFRQTFLKQIVPAFESACRTMTHQLDDSLIRGFKEHSDTSRNDMLELSQSIQSTLEATRAMLENQGESPLQKAHSTSTASSMRTAKPHDYKAELQGLIRHGKFEEAFSKALSLQDLSLVYWLCSTIDAPTVLSQSPPALSQMVLLSLLQQLSADLNQGTAIKLQWIREAALAINPSDHSIATHVKPVLQQVASALQAVLPKLQLAEASSCKLTLHVVRSQLTT
ncbi:hypothetical protein M9435_006476 [Picochlorum sp. BPE23]|nr:hypothetical protein M9435_006476 [Picochlorum sp. BPE23]